MTKYDVAIVGTGMGGLVSACYLARAGLKVVAIEKNEKIGGFCSSFERNGFIFDAGPHSLGSCREDGYLGTVIRELGMSSKIQLGRSDPSDIISTPKYEIKFWNDSRRTLRDIEAIFPSEKESLRRWFRYITKTSVESLYMQLRGRSLVELLNSFFHDNALKSILSVPIENLGEPPLRASAWSSTLVLREHLFDGGYYPRGGMQHVAEAFRNSFEALGGEVRLGTRVGRILTGNDKARGLTLLPREEVIEARTFVSNADMQETARLLSGSDKKYSEMLQSRINNRGLRPGTSAVVGYFGIQGQITGDMANCASYWHCKTDRLLSRTNLTVSELESNRALPSHVPFLCSIPSAHDPTLAPKGMSSAYVFMNCEVNGSLGENADSRDVREKIIGRFEEVIPSLRLRLVHAEVALPRTFFKYNLCTGGSIRGWSCSMNHETSVPVRQAFPIRNLYYAGHWASRIGPGGVAMAVLSGRKVAQLILRAIGKDSGLRSETSDMRGKI